MPRYWGGGLKMCSKVSFPTHLCKLLKEGLQILKIINYTNIHGDKAKRPSTGRTKCYCACGVRMGGGMI